jgi:hypothetical protein
MIEQKLRRRLRFLTWMMIIGIMISGATALPVQTELNFICAQLGLNAANASATPLGAWLWRISESLHEINQRYPFIAYGTDWLAFGHFAIGIVFLGALRDPVRNRWLYQFGMIASILVIPYAFLAGSFRGIPLFWRLIDCSFGVGGFIPMWFCYRYSAALEDRLRGVEIDAGQPKFFPYN